MTISKQIDRFHENEWVIQFSFAKGQLEVDKNREERASQLLKELGLSHWSIKLTCTCCSCCGFPF